MNAKASLFKKLIIGALALSPVGLQAQNVNYKIMKNDPKDAVNAWVYLDPMQMDFCVGNLMGSSFNLGAWTVLDYKNKMGAEAIGRYGYLTFAKFSDKDLKAHRQFEGGVFLHLTDKIKVRNTKIILSQSSGTNSQGQSVTTTKYIMVPADKRVRLGVRGGAMHIGGPFDPSSALKPDPEIENLGAMNYGLTGIYLGLLNTSNKSVLINTDSHGKRGNFRYDRVSFDVMFFPVRSVKQGDADRKDVVKPGMLGWRFQWMALPSEVRKMKGYDVKTRGLTFGVEVGMRPIDGLYFGGTMAICLYRGKTKALGYVQPASEQNTSE